jgi:hypothetical protein
MFVMQNTGSLREKLHHYIDIADEQKLQAIYVLLEEHIEKEHVYSKEEIEMFYERRKRHLAGEGSSYTIEESIDRIRKNGKG